MHSHNDYQRERPLLDALTQKFDSIEADIWLSHRQVVISHLGLFYVGNLKQMYLDPLQELVTKRGSVYGDNRSFFLWLDIKDGDPDLVEVLHSLLNQYSMFTVFTDSKVIPGPVTAVLTGNPRSKSEFVDKHAVRKACRDSETFNISDPKVDHRWLWYSLKWGDLFRWGGYSQIKNTEKEQLFSLVKHIHDKGRRVRFWDAPENNEFWRVASEARVDLLGADHLEKLADFRKASERH